MELQIQKKEERPLLKRTDVVARIAFQGATPSKKEAIKALTKALNAKQELVIVREIKTAFGDQTALIFGSVYQDKETLEKLEIEALRKKHADEKKEDKTGGEA